MVKLLLQSFVDDMQNSIQISELQCGVPFYLVKKVNFSLQSSMTLWVPLAFPSLLINCKKMYIEMNVKNIN